MTPSSKKAASSSSTRGSAKQPASGPSSKPGKPSKPSKADKASKPAAQTPAKQTPAKGSGTGGTARAGAGSSRKAAPDTATIDAGTDTPPKGRARVLQASKEARSKARQAKPAGGRASSRASRAAAPADDDEVLTGEVVDDRAGPEPDGYDEDAPAPAARGWRALLAPTSPDYVAPKDRPRPWWGMGDIAIWGAVTYLLLVPLVAIPFGAVLKNMGYDLFWPAGDGARLGEATRQWSSGQPVQLTQSGADVPLWIYQLYGSLPLWIGFIAGPVFVSWRKGLGFVRDWKVRMELIDVPIGLAVGVAGQLVLVPVLYKLLFLVVPEQDVSARARDLTDRATSPLMVVLLFVMVAIITPIAEELFFRGLSHQAFKKRLGRWWGATATSALFAITHRSYILIPPLFIFAFALSWLVDRFDRIGPAVWGHIGFNTVTLVSLVWNLGIA